METEKRNCYGYAPVDPVPACPFCGGPMQGQRVCPWCGYDPLARKMVRKYTFPFSKPDFIEPGWPVKRSLPLGKAFVIALISAAFGAASYFLLPYLIQAVFSQMKSAFLMLIVEIVLFGSLYVGVSIGAARLINRWGKSNGGAWGVVFALIAILPTVVYQSLVINSIVWISSFWGLIAASLLIGAGGVLITGTSEAISSCRFCRDCAEPMHVLSKTLTVHSGNTVALLEALREGQGPEACDSLQTSAERKVAQTTVHLHVCERCHIGLLELKQHRTYVKNIQPNLSGKNAKTKSQTVGYVPVEGARMEKWAEKLK